MTKLMTAAHAATAFAAIALASPSAEAAFSVPRIASKEISLVEQAGCHGGGRSYVARRHVRIAKQSVKPKVQVAARKAKPVTIAKIEPVKEVAPTESAAATADESSSITPIETTVSTPAAAVLPVQAAEVKPVVAEEKKVANKDLGCKAFFPAAGITLSVPCK